MSRILCAMSGGVDSSVAAHLLREAGHEVIGVFLRLGPDAVESSRSVRPEFSPPPKGTGVLSPLDPPKGTQHRRGCCSVEDSRDAARVAARLGIPFYALDYEREFARVIDYFVEEYHRGRTPNPCARCNQWLKFGSLLERAEALGCEAVATGHYARVSADDRGRPQLRRAADSAKDQSYFLFALPGGALGKIRFPVGELTKTEVRALARRAELPVAEKPDSQEICFVPGDYREVLRARGADRMRPGRIVDGEGNVLGEHPGHQHFTIGQRRGLGVAAGSARYVVGIAPERNEVVLGAREELAVGGMVVEEVRFVSIDEPAPGETLAAEVQVRHRHRAVAARLDVEAPGRVRVSLTEPVDAVTPGQAAVFYRGPLLLGGGWIAEAR